jgi:hypothetical protein
MLPGLLDLFFRCHDASIASGKRRQLLELESGLAP